MEVNGEESPVSVRNALLALLEQGRLRVAAATKPEVVEQVLSREEPSIFAEVAQSGEPAMRSGFGTRSTSSIVRRVGIASRTRRGCDRRSRLSPRPVSTATTMPAGSR